MQSVIFYDHETEKFTGNQLAKAKKLLDGGYVSLISSHRQSTYFQIRPLPGQKRFYRVKPDGSHCNCQGYAKNDKCTHTMLVEKILSSPGNDRWKLIAGGGWIG